MWATKADCSIYRWNGSGWDIKAPGCLAMITVGSKSQVWGLGSAGGIVKWNGTGWGSIVGNLVYISAAADGTVFGVGSDHHVVSWNGSGWVPISGLLDEVSVGGQGAVYGRSATSVFSYANSAWTLITAPPAYDIAANPDGLWIRGTNQTTYLQFGPVNLDGHGRASSVHTNFWG